MNELIKKLCKGLDLLNNGIESLSLAMNGRPTDEDPLTDAAYMHDTVLPAMEALRKAADELEMITDRKAWPFPTYDELLFNI